jgi:hypothetical protein
MKLILCPVCHDVRKLDYRIVHCKCGASSGWYEDDGLNATIQGEAIPIGFNNSSLVAAVRNQPEAGAGEVFTAFVMPKICPTLAKLLDD